MCWQCGKSLSVSLPAGLQGSSEVNEIVLFSGDRLALDSLAAFSRCADVIVFA